MKDIMGVGGGGQTSLLFQTRHEEAAAEHLLCIAVFILPLNALLIYSFSPILDFSTLHRFFVSHPEKKLKSFSAQPPSYLKEVIVPYYWATYVLVSIFV